MFRKRCKLLVLEVYVLYVINIFEGSLESRNCLQVWSNFVPLMSGLGSAISTATLFWASKVRLWRALAQRNQHNCSILAGLDFMI